VTQFAFYGRVSTEDQQDPESSRAWQLARSRSLIEPHGGVIVAEFFDVGLSRSLPWKRRPQANALLDALRHPDRGFGGVVIGEPARAFFGNQFGLTFPLFEHFGVELWVPEVGGRVDPGSDAHDLVMSLYGGMSKGERNRIKIRVRAAMAAQAKEQGRFLGGRPPYGYRLADAGPHPNPGKAAVGQRLHQLEVDPETGPVAQRIFRDYAAGRGLYSIAESLTRGGIPCPSAYDRERNPHRCGLAWSKPAVRAILANPRYTGRQVWNRQRRDEVLIDVDDVALGHQTRMRWNSEMAWVWSAEPSHEAIVTAELFEQVQAQLQQGTRRGFDRKARSSERPYALKGLVRCGVCQRRMEGTWNNDRPHYRCRFPSEYALANRIERPRSVYLREDAVLSPLDGWLGRLFEPRKAHRILAGCALIGRRSSPAPASSACRRRAALGSGSSRSCGTRSRSV
jgi:site-specific DNA recombinase